METVFSPGVLERLASSDALIALDFDGTLAPIVDDPAKAAMRTGTRHLLAQVAQRYPCAVVSGRPEEDVLRLLQGVTVWYVIGNRALQPPQRVEELTKIVRGWQPLLREKLAGLEGVSLEDKGLSVAVHHRHAPDARRVAAAVSELASQLGEVRMVAGKDVINLAPGGADAKGAALGRLMKQLGCACALYAGDDRTDEDAFALPGVVPVRVGRDEGSKARFFIHDQLEVDELLSRLVDLRDRPAQRVEARRR